MTAVTEIWTYRNLIYNLAQRELRARYKKSLLGWLWSLINPAAMLGIYTVVFGVFFNTEPPRCRKWHYQELWALSLCRLGGVEHVQLDGDRRHHRAADLGWSAQQGLLPALGSRHRQPDDRGTPSSDRGRDPRRDHDRARQREHHLHPVPRDVGIRRVVLDGDRALRQRVQRLLPGRGLFGQHRHASPVLRHADHLSAQPASTSTPPSGTSSA